MARPARPTDRHRTAIALALALCGGCSQDALVGRSAPFTQDASPRYDTAPVDGPGYVDGRLHAHAVFNTVGAVYWFGGSNDSSKLELYVFEGDPTCADVSVDGWLPSSKVRPSDLMGITIAGNRPGVYPIVPETPPKSGHAYVLHVIDQADPVVESEGLGGTVTITSVKPGEVVSGAFESTFSTGSLQGSINAVWCPTGDGL